MNENHTIKLGNLNGLRLAISIIEKATDLAQAKRQIETDIEVLKVELQEAND